MFYAKNQVSYISLCSEEHVPRPVPGRGHAEKLRKKKSDKHGGRENTRNFSMTHDSGGKKMERVKGVEPS